MDPVQDQIFAEYLSGTREMLDKAAALLRGLEKNGFDRSVLQRISRDVHTIKGSSQIIGYAQISRVAQSTEACLERLLDKPKEAVSSFDPLRNGLSVMAQLLAGVATTKSEPLLADEVSGVVAQLAKIGTGPSPLNHGEPDQTPAMLATTPAAAPSPVAASNMPQATAAVPQPKATAAPAVAAPAKAASDETPADSSIRVQVELLDNLVNLVGELVLVRNQIQQLGKQIDDGDLQRVGQRLNVVTSELQADVMKTRMQQVGTVLNKFHRIVRDMARDLHKAIELKLEGTETELDKTLIEAVRDPLIHIVRNAVDHGIESPAERKRLGKPEVATIRIRAVHESGYVLVEIADDGKGLNREKIAAKALELGLVTAEALAHMTEREIQQFVFLPGFSTADKVSHLSGRGVGMDVVKTNIESIGGAIELASTENAGTVLRLKIPLTLAIIPALLVRAGGERFAIAQVKLLELIRVEDAASHDRDGGHIELLQGCPVYRLRGNLLPLVFLSKTLGLSSAAATTDKTTHQIAVLSADRRTFGLVVDDIEDSADIVVKPLPSFFKDLGVYSGATVMGDGSIALVLDATGLATKEGLTAGESSAKTLATPNEPAREPSSEASEYLLVQLGAPGKYAIPLGLVSRLEEFTPADVQLSGTRRLVKYRGNLLPLISVNAALGFPVPSQTTEAIAVVVVHKGSRDFGLEVMAIIDVVSSHSRIDTNLKDHHGILGSLIEGQDVITLVDALNVIDQTGWVGSPPLAHAAHQ